MKYPALAFTVVVLASLFPRTGLASPPTGKPGVKKESFGTLPDGTSVDLYTITNAQGMEIRATNYGGIVVSLRVPDKKGNLDDIALGFDDLKGYLANTPYFGAPNGISFQNINSLVPDGPRNGEIRSLRTPMRIVQFSLKLSL